MQGQIGGTPANALLLAVALEILALGACALSVGLSPARGLASAPQRRRQLLTMILNYA